MNDKEQTPSSLLFGVGEIKPDEHMPETGLQFRKGKGDLDQLKHALSELEKKGIKSKEAQLMILRASTITKEAATNSLRNSANKKRGEHLHLFEPEKEELITESHGEETGVKIDPNHTHYARLQELMSLGGELTEECFFNLRQSVGEAVNAAYNDDMKLGCVYLERTVLHAAELLRGLKLFNARAHENFATIQNEQHRKITLDTIQELFDLRIEQKIAELPSQEAHAFSQKMHGLVEMFFGQEQVRTPQ